MVFTVGGIKGGTGKSTIATNLTICLLQQGKKVLLVDADDQRSAAIFTEWRDHNLNGKLGYTFSQLKGKGIYTQILNFKKDYPFIVIDAGGRDTESQRAAMIASDALLLPFQPRGLDCWTIDPVLKLLQIVRELRPEPLPALAFINRADIRSEDNREVVARLQGIEAFTFLDSPITNRKAFSNAVSRGLGVIELLPQDKKATREINNLVIEILKVSAQKLVTEYLQ